MNFGMHPAIVIAALVVGIEHLFIMYLETFATTSARTSAAFGLSFDELNNEVVSTLLKNQGVYNGLLAIVLIVSALFLQSKIFVEMLFCFVFLVAVYGSRTSSKKILYVQGGPALIGILLCVLL